MERESFIFYSSFHEAGRFLQVEQRNMFYAMIIEYGISGIIKPYEDPTVKSLFALIKPQLDANNKRFENGTKGKKFGTLGGRPKKQFKSTKSNNNPTGDNNNNPTGKKSITPNVNVNVNDNVNDNDNDKIYTYTNEFEKFRSEYPIKKGKAEAYIAWKTALKISPHEQIIEGAKKYAEWCAKTQTDKIKWAQGWLNNRRWEDEIDVQAKRSDGFKLL